MGGLSGTGAAPGPGFNRRLPGEWCCPRAPDLPQGRGLATRPSDCVDSTVFLWFGGTQCGGRLSNLLPQFPSRRSCGWGPSSRTGGLRVLKPQWSTSVGLGLLSTPSLCARKRQQGWGRGVGWSPLSVSREKLMLPWNTYRRLPLHPPPHPPLLPPPRLPPLFLAEGAQQLEKPCSAPSPHP